jgi:hypothetical protein
MRHLSFVLLLVSALYISSYGAARASDESFQSSPTTVNPSQFPVTKHQEQHQNEFIGEQFANEERARLGAAKTWALNVLRYISSSIRDKHTNGKLLPGQSSGGLRM